VVLNLAVNARDAMPDGGLLTISGRNVEQPAKNGDGGSRMVELRVTDTGAGMDEETRRRAVEPFFTTKPEGKGTGLGLSTVFGIVQQHGGSLAIESQPGRGTSVRVLLPRVEGEAKQVRPVVRRPGRGGETVLLVDDDAIVRRVARRGLEQYGYRVLEAACGDDALALAGEHEAELDALVTDLAMPGMGGKELVESLLAWRPGLPVVIISGSDLEEEGVGKQLARRCRFLAKPVDGESLAACVREVLDAAATVGFH